MNENVHDQLKHDGWWKKQIKRKQFSDRQFGHKKKNVTSEYFKSLKLKKKNLNSLEPFYG